MEGKGLPFAQNQVKTELGGILIKNWSVFLPATAINIAFCPPELRVLFLNCVLCAAAHHPHRRTVPPRVARAISLPLTRPTSPLTPLLTFTHRPAHSRTCGVATAQFRLGDLPEPLPERGLDGRGLSGRGGRSLAARASPWGGGGFVCRCFVSEGRDR